MAVIHISEAEAARDLAGLLARVRSGEQVQIDSAAGSFDLVPSESGDSLTTPMATEDDALPAPRYSNPRKLSEILADMERYPCNVLLDDKFGEDMEAIIRQHEHERLIDPWEAF